MGTIQLNSDIILKNVLCVPDFTFNIVSLTKVTLQNSCIMIRDHSTCILQDPTTTKRIGSAKWHKDLYVLDCVTLPYVSSYSVPIVSSVVNNSFATNDVVPIQFDPADVSKLLWHYKLGHASILVYRSLNKQIQLSLFLILFIILFFLWQNNINPVFPFMFLFQHHAFN
ncbi:hypothetical protein M9H77_18539 [Catharanthus roseus]|uniref:Uncharacterized protein n=1 Tax=Catharanthus roseus TaxID=4058 RepID=A0ACC0B7R5_CATRO|nr:hypothetical protein M9H77_18539 [Catharanthus roseus]